MIVYQNFEWDLREAAANLAGYGVSFKEAATVFAAENVAVTEDLDSDQLYARGLSSRGRTLIVLHTRGVRIRILGAMVQQAEATTAADVAPERKDEESAHGSEIARSDAARAASTGAVVAQDGEAPRPIPEANVGLGIAAGAGTLDAAADREPLEDVVARPAEANAKATALGTAAGEARAATETGAAATEPRAAAKKKSPALAALRRGGPLRVPREDATPPLAPVPSKPVVAAAPSHRPLGSGLTADEYDVYWAAYSAAREDAKGQGKSLKEAQRIGRQAGERAVVAPRAPATATTPAVVAPKPAPKRALSWRAAARGVK